MKESAYGRRIINAIIREMDAIEAEEAQTAAELDELAADQGFIEMETETVAEEPNVAPPVETAEDVEQRLTEQTAVALESYTQRLEKALKILKENK